MGCKRNTYFMNKKNSFEKNKYTIFYFGICLTLFIVFVIFVLFKKKCL